MKGKFPPVINTYTMLVLRYMSPVVPLENADDQNRIKSMVFASRISIHLARYEVQ